MARIALRRLGRGRVLNVATCAALLLGLAVVVASTEPADPTPQVHLSGGSAWLVSPSVAAATLVDGPSEQVVASRRLDATPNDELTLTQAGTDAYAVDHTQGTVARIDGATLEVGPGRKFADTAGALRLVGGTDALYALDANRGLASRADPVSLQPQSEISLAARPRPDQIVVDHNGRLWLVDADRGGLIWVDGATKHESDEPPGPDAQLVLVRGRPVLADLAAGELHTLDDDGDITSTTCLDVRDGAATQLLGSATQETVYGAVSDTGTLLVAGTTTDDCASALPVSQPHDILGAPVASDRFVFIPNITKGTTVIVDTESRQVVPPELNLVHSGHHLELIAKDGLVFYNDLDGDKAGVLTYDGATWRVGKSLSKYDPNTGKPADLDVNPLDSSNDSPSGAAADTTTVSESQPTSTSGSLPQEIESSTSKPPAPAVTPSPPIPQQSNGSGTTADVRVTGSVNGAGRVTGPGGLNCPGTCAVSVAAHTAVTFIAQPALLGATVSWGGSCAGQSGACTLTPSDDATFSVTFTPPTPAEPVLTVTAIGPGTVSAATQAGAVNCAPTCDNVVLGDQVTLVAMPVNSGSTLASWSGPCSGQSATCGFTLSGDTSVTASFAATPLGTISVRWGNGPGGSVDVLHGNDPAQTCASPGCDLDFPQGDTVTLHPNGDGWVFEGWAAFDGCGRGDCQIDVVSGTTVVQPDFVRFSLSPVPLNLRAPSTNTLRLTLEGATGAERWTGFPESSSFDLSASNGDLSGGSALVQVSVHDPNGVRDGLMGSAVTFHLQDSFGTELDAQPLEVLTNLPPQFGQVTCTRPSVGFYTISIPITDADPVSDVTVDFGSGPEPTTDSGSGVLQTSFPSFGVIPQQGTFATVDSVTSAAISAARPITC